MNFEQFQNQSRLYVIGALEAEELEEFEQAREKFGKKAEDFISKCYALHEAFALEPASGEVFRRDQGSPHGHGKGQEAILTVAPFSSQQSSSRRINSCRKP